jgi:hypothetical protein
LHHGLLAGVATYTERGELFNIAVDPLTPGDYLPHPAKPQTVDEAIKESIGQFGFPLTFAVDQFRKKPTPLYQRTDRPVPLTVVSLHYARNRWVEQHIFHDVSAEYEKRFLEFRYTAQDNDLRFFDQDLTWAPATDQRMFFGKK